MFRFLFRIVFCLLAPQMGLYGYANIPAADLYKQALELVDSDTKKSVELAKALLEVGNSNDDQYAQVKSHLLLGYISEAKDDDYGKALINYFEALRHGLEGSYDELSEDLHFAHLRIGDIYSTFGEFGTALQHYESSEQILEEDQEALKFQSQNKIISILILKEDYQLALDLADKAAAKFPNELMSLYLKKAEIFQLTKAYQQSNDQYLLALEIVERNTEDIGNKLNISIALAHNFEEVLNYEMAAFWYKNVLNLGKAGSNESEVFFEALLGYSRTTSKSLSYEEALARYDSIQNYLKEFQEDLMDSHKMVLLTDLASLHEDNGNYKQANGYRKAHAKILEDNRLKQLQIEKIDKNNQLDLITQRYYSLLRQEQKNEQIELIIYTSVLSVLSLFGLFLAISQYRKYQLKRELEKSVRRIQEQS